jgi:hypothetical protein
MTRHTKKIKERKKTKGKRTKRQGTRGTRTKRQSVLIEFEKPKVDIENYGETTTFINSNNQKSKRQIKWKGNFKDDKLNLQVDLIKDNKHKKFNLNMNKEQIENILNRQPDTYSDTLIAERLTNDFLKNDRNRNQNLIGNNNEKMKRDMPVFLNNELLLVPRKQE